MKTKASGGRPARSGERGAIAVLMGFMMTIIMGFAALGFDMAYIRLARQEMKTASDAAAHAAMTVLRIKKGDTGSAKTAAITVAGKNFVNGHAVILDSTDVVFGVWDYATDAFSAGSTPANAVQISGRKSDPLSSDGKIKTTLGRALHVGEAQVAQTSFSAFRPRAMMFEMDVTGSFLQTSCAMDAAIAADLAFLDAMYASGNAKDRIGLDVFTGEAYPFTPLQFLVANYNAIRTAWKGDELSALSASHEWGLGVCTQDPIRTDSNWNCATKPSGKWPNQAFLDFDKTIENPKCWGADDTHFKPPVSTVEVFGGTNIGAAIKRGKETLLTIGKSYEVRSIVVFTDGGPLCCEAKAGGDICPAGKPNPCCADVTAGGCSDNGSGACECSKQIRDLGWAQANAADAAGIDVYVLAFGNKTNWINYAKSLARGRGFTLDTNDPAELKGKLEQIANAIPVALVK